MLTYDQRRHSVCRVQRGDQPQWVRDYRRALGARIRDLRMRANLTQLALCEATGVDRITLQRVEAGTSDARIGELALIARAVGVSIADLVTV